MCMCINIYIYIYIYTSIICQDPVSLLGPLRSRDLAEPDDRLPDIYIYIYIYIYCFMYYYYHHHFY